MCALCCPRHVQATTHNQPQAQEPRTEGGSRGGRRERPPCPCSSARRVTWRVVVPGVAVQHLRQVAALVARVRALVRPDDELQAVGLQERLGGGGEVAGGGRGSGVGRTIFFGGGGTPRVQARKRGSGGPGWPQSHVATCPAARSSWAVRACVRPGGAGAASQPAGGGIPRHVTTSSAGPRYVPHSHLCDVGAKDQPDSARHVLLRAGRVGVQWAAGEPGARLGQAASVRAAGLAS